MRVTYLTSFSVKRKAFHFFSTLVGLVCSRVFDLHFIILTYFLFLFLNSFIILYGSNSKSLIWNFYIKRLGYEKVVGIVGNPWSAILSSLTIKSLPKVAILVKPAVKVCGGLLILDSVVGYHFVLYDFIL